MGYSSQAENILFFIPALSRALAVQGFKTDMAAGLDAALAELDRNVMNSSAKKTSAPA